MKKYIKLTMIIFIFLIFFVKANALSKDDNILTIKTDTSSVNVNQEFFIYVTSSKINNLFSLSFDLKFNPTVIKILSIEPGNFFKDEPIEFNSKFNMLSDEATILTCYETFTGKHTGKSSESEEELLKLKVKLLKNSKVPLNIINTYNNLYIGGPNIRIVLVDNFLNKCNFSSSPKYVQTQEFLSDDDIKSFISDVYKKTFSREPEELGFNYWYNKLISYEYSVRNFLTNILNEQEFITKNLSNEEFITAMYSIIANREPDQIGYNYWLNMLLDFQNKFDIKKAKSNIILLICNETELKQRSEKMNLKF